MPVYQYQGVYYQLSTTDPAEAKQKILASLQKTYTPPQTPVSAMPPPVEGSGGAAFGVYRPAGRRPESQQDRAAAAEMPLQMARGVVTGAVGAPADIANLPGVVYGAVTGQAPGYHIPGGSEDVNAVLPGASNTPHARLARFAGETIAPVPTVKGLQAGAEAVKSGVQAVAPVVREAVTAVPEVARGAYGGLFNTITPPGTVAKPWETASVRQPLGDTYIPADVLEQWRQGQITGEQAQSMARPTAELPQQALRQTQGMVPYAGQEYRALGEQIGSSYRDPYKLAAEAAGDIMLGGLPTVARLGLKANEVRQGLNAYKQLGQAGFTPVSQAEHQALQTGGYNPAATAPISPAEYSQQAAAAKITPPAQPVQPPANVANTMTEEQLKMWNNLKRSEDTNKLIQQLKESGDPRAISLAELLEKQGYNYNK